MAPLGSPYGVGEDDSFANDAVELQRLRALLAGMGGDVPQPQMPPSPGIRTPRVGPIPSMNLSGDRLDSASAAMLAALQNGPTPSSGGGRFVHGLMSGFAGARTQGAGRRRQEYEAAKAKADERNRASQSFNQSAVRSLQEHRQQVAGRAPAAGAERYKLTRKEAEAMGEGYDTATSYSREIKDEAMTRSRPVDPSIREGRELLNQDRMGRAQAAADKQAEDDALLEDYSEKVATFRIKPDDIPKRDPRWNAALQSRIDNKLMAKGSPYNLQQLDQLWRSTKKWTETSNAQRAVNTRKAAMTVLDHINQFEGLVSSYRGAYDKLPALKKAELRIGNRGVFTAALNGALGPQAAADAAGLEAVVNVLPTEYATVLSGGFAPQKEQLDEARRVFSAVLGPAGHKGRTEAVRRLIKARVQNEQRNFNMIGGEKNPYLMEISKLEGWDLDKPLDANPKKEAADEKRRLYEKYR